MTAHWGEPSSAQANNPKHAAGLAKQPFRHIPKAPIAAMGRVMAGGSAQYGPFNWGEAGVVASTYIDAIRRHLDEYETSGSTDRKSGESHLAHIMASCGIMMDCEAMGNLEDDRPIGKTTPCIYSEPTPA